MPVTKTLFIDLLDPSYKVNATQTIKDVDRREDRGAWRGDRTSRTAGTSSTSSATTTLFPGLPTQIYAFAIDGAAANIKRRPQIILFPVVSPLDFLFRWFW